jgi:hypothetical protein
LAANFFLIDAVPQFIVEARPSSFDKLLNLFERLERDQRRAAADPKEIAA